MERKVWMKILGLVLSVSFVVGLIGGVLTNEYFVGYIFSSFIQKQEENLPIVKKVIEKQTFVEDSLTIEAIENVKPALVTLYADKKAAEDALNNNLEKTDSFISLTSDEFYLDKEGTNRTGNYSGGNGFFITSDGLIFSCQSLVGNQNEWYLIDSENQVLKANLVYSDNENDIAFLQLENEENEYYTTLPFVEYMPKIGQNSLAIGNDVFNLNHVKSGIVSYIPFINEEETELINKLAFPSDFIHVDFEVDKSFQCGPLVNLGGELIGTVYDFDTVEQGTTYIVPVQIIQESLNEFKKTLQ